jgi:hypothetical protein
LEAQFKLRGVTKDHPGHQVAMALVAEHDGLARSVGSAFAVAPGLAITASHVIDDCVNYREKRDGSITFTDVSPLILPSCALPVRIGGETDRAKSNPSMLGSISILQQSATRFECLVSQF